MKIVHRISTALAWFEARRAAGEPAVDKGYPEVAPSPPLTFDEIIDRLVRISGDPSAPAFTKAWADHWLDGFETA